MTSPAAYRPPTGVAAWFNRLVRALGGLGLSLYGSRNLAVRGRRPGAWQVVPVNPLSHDGARYLVAPRGVTHWVRNLRAGGEAELRLGRRSEPIRALELDDADKPPILRAYLARWLFEVKEFFPGLGPDASDAALRAAAPRYPVFRIEPRA
ncbi:MAG: nitroreductase family deazaflavin-dependent oxidoreductase [bacterium]|nr:nitroreductase family deazaflavin-dependent oxidoreductase [bacterium]